MAIEFNCPYCTATVRVGDEASGKIGRCPKCETRIRVPAITPPSAGVPSAPPQSIEETPSDTDIPLFAKELAPQREAPLPTPPQAEGVPHLDVATPGTPIIQPKPDPATISPYLRKRRQRTDTWGSLLPPVLFGSVFVIVGLIYWYSSQPSFQGTLTAVRENPDQAIATSIDGSNFNISQDVFESLTDDLREHPSAIRSNLVNITFSGGPKGMELSLRPGIDADLVQVPVSQIGSIAAFYRSHYNTLNDARLQEMQAALASLCEDWVIASEAEKTATLPNYRDKIGYNAFVFGLGRICEAIVGNARYPCVHEDSSGNLYFLIPIGTKSFLVQERIDLDETPYFPSKFEVKVTLPTATSSSRPTPPIEAEPNPIPYQAPDQQASDAAPEDG